MVKTEYLWEESLNLDIQLAHIVPSSRNQMNGIICCLTVYNEPGIAILVSIASLIRNLSYLYIKNEISIADNTILCIVADGIENMSDTATELFSELEISFSVDQGVCINDRLISYDQINSLMSKMGLNNEENRCWAEVYRASFKNWKSSTQDIETDHSKKIHILSCVKGRNRGKLDSHWWFFKIICTAYNPAFCIQIDAGTAPADNAIFNCIRSFKTNPAAGAIAGMILINPPGLLADLIHIWQSGDFIYQKLMNWPTEVLLGYLTVIPGQFSFYRWKAIYVKEVNYSYKDSIVTPLENYFRGLRQLGPFESNMFLAEDRILGFEILSNGKSNWDLIYVPSVIAITEPCDTLKELLQQRRRWNNSCHACHIWLISQFGRILKKESAPLIKRLHSLLCIPWLSLDTVFMLIFPAFVTVLLKAFLIQVEWKLNLTNPVNNSLSYVFIAFCGLFLIQLFFFVRTGFGNLSKFIFLLFSSFAGILYLSLLFFLFTNGLLFGDNVVLACLIIFEPIAVLLLSLCFSWKVFTDLSKILLQYFFLRPLLFLQTTVYSLCNLNDCTWGTKGNSIWKNGITNEDSRNALNKFSNFRLIFLSAWLFVNVLIVYASLSVKTVSIMGLINSVVTVLLIFSGIKLLGGIALLLKEKWSNQDF